MKTYKGVFWGWAKMLKRAGESLVEFEIWTTVALGPRLEIRLKRTRAQRVDDGAIVMVAADGVVFAADMLGRCLEITLGVDPTASKLEMHSHERAQFILAVSAAYLMAKLAHDAQKSREEARSCILRSFAGWLRDGDHPGVIAERVTASVWGLR